MKKLYNFEASLDFVKSIANIETLKNFAIAEGDKGHENNRLLFLKLGIVSIVTRFQVFIEGILADFDYKLRQSKKRNRDIPLHMRINAIKIFATKKSLIKELENPDNYNLDKLTLLEEHIELLLGWCKDDKKIFHPDSIIETNFPLGSTGTNELIKLFKQIDGKNIFEGASIDINKLNEILQRRHRIIHEDANQQITEITIEEYKVYLLSLVKFIDGYLFSFLPIKRRTKIKV